MIPGQKRPFNHKKRADMIEQRPFKIIRSLSSLLLVVYSVHSAPVECPSDPKIQGYVDVKTFNKDNFEGPADQTYILCPNTTFAESCGLDGGDWMVIWREGTKVQCGADGSSQNNCIFTRDAGNKYNNCPFISLIAEEKISPTAVTLQGLTFLGQPHDVQLPMRDSAVRFDYGEVTMEDCHFENLTMGVSYDVMTVGQSNLTLRDSSFFGNAGGGLLRLTYSTVTISNTYFRCNEVVSNLMYAYQAREGTFALSESCFVDNMFNLDNIFIETFTPPSESVDVKAGTVFENGSKVQNVAGGVDIWCTGVTQRNFSDIECVDFLGKTCSLPMNDATCPPRRMPQSPTPTPPPAPTSSAMMATTIPLSAFSWLAGVIFLLL